MEKILAHRFSFCDFSQIVGFPNALPDRYQWEYFLLKFHASDWEEPAEHLLDFHEAIHRHNITHEDVHIKLFRFSLKGSAREWCWSLPTTSIRSLAGFHTAFNSFCKDYYPAVHLFESCCKEFSSLHEASVGPEYHVHDKAFSVEEIIFHEKIEVLNDISGVSSRMEASDIILDVSILLDVHKDQHASCGDYELVKQMWSTVDGSPKCRVEANIPSNPVSEDCKDRRLGEEAAISELMTSLIAQHARLKSEDNGEDFRVSKADVLDGSLEENIEDLISALTSVPDKLVVSEQNDEVVVREEDCSLFLHKISHDVFTFGIEKEDLEIVPFLQDEEV
jgi:hypothetical protein